MRQLVTTCDCCNVKKYAGGDSIEKIMHQIEIQPPTHENSQFLGSERWDVCIECYKAIKKTMNERGKNNG